MQSSSAAVDWLFGHADPAELAHPCDLRVINAGASMALLGLDNFRSVNDLLGHRIGDAMLQVIASRLMSCLPVDACLARCGGDGFAIGVVRAPEETLGCAGRHCDAPSGSVPARSDGSSPNMRTQAIDRRRLDLELRRALRHVQFELHYQPQVAEVQRTVDGR